MQQISLYPFWYFDIAGSIAMVVLSAASMHLVLRLYRRDPENALNTYLLWLISAIFVFCLFRALGHLVKYVLLFSGHDTLWHRIAPVSGGLNSITFVVIFAVTIFFRDILTIMNRMTRDRLKIEKTSSQLLELNRDIEAVVSDRTKAEMALQIAHGIRNPVMVIGGLLKRLYRDSTPSAGERKVRDAILDQIRQLEHLVRGFENLQMQFENHFSTIELNALVHDALEIVRHEAEQKKITILFTPSSTPLPLYGNQQYLKVALLHLLRNAIEACGENNHIRVAVGQTGEGAMVRIEDNGPGIPGEVLEHIFEPFYSTKAGATGLGLPYVRQIIHEHRGDIRIRSTPGVGTSVQLTFPTHLATLQDSGPAEPPETADGRPGGHAG